MYSHPVASYLIPAANFSTFAKKMKSIARRAARLGVGEVSYDDHGEEWISEACPRRSEAVHEAGACSRCDEKGRVWRQVRRVTVHGDRVVLPGGWRLAARVEPYADGVNMIHVVPGYEGTSVPAEYRTAANRCDHCNTARRRKDLFAAVNDAGEWMLLGRNCLRDFTGLGAADPLAVARYSELLCDLVAGLDGEGEGFGFGGGGGRADYGYDLADYLAVCASYIRAHGWVSRSAAGGCGATADDALYYFNGPFRRDPKSVAAWRREVEAREPTDADRAEAAAALDWARGLEGASDYEHNLLTIAAAPAVSARHAGYAASIVSGYQRHHDRMVARELESERRARLGEAADAAGHYGEIKARCDVIVTLAQRVKWFDGQFGKTALHVLTTEEGHRLKWWASESAARKAGFEVGEAVRVLLTVKAHGEYNGTPETTVQRVARA